MYENFDRLGRVHMIVFGKFTEAGVKMSKRLVKRTVN